MRRIGLLVVGLIVLVAACGDDAGGTTTSATTAATTTTTAAATTTTTAVTTTTAPATTTTAATTTTTVVLGPTISMADTAAGRALVDDEGMTLYLFLPDEQGAPQCNGGCAATWPPLVGVYFPGDGVNAARMGTVARGDGSLQVTYNGWPLYRYAPDNAPGDANGQGAGANWWVVDADGEPIM